MRVHTALGPGLLESPYEACLCHELVKLFDSATGPSSCVHDGITLEVSYRIDLIGDGLVIVEMKCVERISSVHEAQILSYLKVSGKSVGLLLTSRPPLQRWHPADLSKGKTAIEILRVL